MLSRHLLSRQYVIAKLVVFLVLFGGLSGLVIIIGRPTLVNAWILATTRKPDHYTTLSFNNTGHLPLYAPAQAPQRVTFHLTNHEGVATTYRYVVLANIDTFNSVLDQGTIVLQDKAGADKTITFTIPTVNIAAQITIQLIGRAEYITFKAHS